VKWVGKVVSGAARLVDRPRPSSSSFVLDLYSTLIDRPNTVHGSRTKDDDEGRGRFCFIPFSARRAPLLGPVLVSNWEDRWPGKILRLPPRPRIRPDRSRLVSGPTDSLLPTISRSFGKLGGAAQLRKHNIQKVDVAQGRCFLS
jgi:hypothetical protein